MWLQNQNTVLHYVVIEEYGNEKLLLLRLYTTFIQLKIEKKYLFVVFTL